MNNIKEKGLIADPSLNMKIAEAIKEYFNMEAIIDLKHFIDYEDEMFNVACMMYRFDEEKKKMSYEIYVPCSELIPEGYDEVHKYRVSEFLEGLGVEENSTTVSICHILHEFGHVKHMSTLDAHDCWREMHFVTETTENFTMVAFGRTDLEDTIEDGVDVMYWLRPHEMFSDAFMYKNFMPVFKYLKEKGLIDNG